MSEKAGVFPGYFDAKHLRNEAEKRVKKMKKLLKIPVRDRIATVNLPETKFVYAEDIIVLIKPERTVPVMQRHTFFEMKESRQMVQ